MTKLQRGRKKLVVSEVTDGDGGGAGGDAIKGQQEGRELEDIILSQTSQAQEDKYCLFTLTCGN